MQGWMIAEIVVASVVLFLTAAFFIGSALAFKKILGRRKRAGYKGELPEKYAVDPSWFDEVKEFTNDLFITAYDGIELAAHLLKHDVKEGEEPVSRVAVLQHGYCASPTAMQPYAKLLFDKGYDVLLPAARGHGKSGGKFIGMAWIDRFDILRWFDKVVELYGEKVKIVAMGVSMGGSTVIAAAGMNPPPQVKCVIDDCGFSSQREEYIACLKNVHLPKSLALLPLSVAVRIRCGYSIGDADITKLARDMTVPALFIHGDSDTFVPCELGKKLFDSCGSADKQMVVFESATHAASYASDKERYTAAVTEFVDKHIG